MARLDFEVQESTVNTYIYASINSSMSKYGFSFPTSIRFGEGIISELGPYLKQHGLLRPLVVTDPNVALLGFFKALISELERQNIRPVVFSDIHANPVKSDVLKGGEVYHEDDCDAVVGIGGGAGMDVARAIVLRVNHHRDLFDYDDLIGGDKYVTGDVPHFVTVPTTSGTGSEVGRSAIISEDESKRKRILFHPKLMAKMVFADPVLTYELPPAITAATGMDALTHNMEAFLAKGFHPLADGIALEGIRLISSSLDKAVNKPDPASRANLMIASLMGAVAFQKGLGVVHSLAHPLSTLLDFHHGLANAIMIPYGMEFNIPGQENRFARIAQSMGIKGSSGDMVVKSLHELNSKIGIPAKLSDKGVTKSHLDHLSELAEADFCHPSNPRPVSRADFLALYQQAL
jgi:alcohol dehydrogenase class IV